jgi:hypothetical protein
MKLYAKLAQKLLPAFAIMQGVERNAENIKAVYDVLNSTLSFEELYELAYISLNPRELKHNGRLIFNEYETHFIGKPYEFYFVALSFLWGNVNDFFTSDNSWMKNLKELLISKKDEILSQLESGLLFQEEVKNDKKKKA